MALLVSSVGKKTNRGGWLTMESLVSHLVMGVLGAGIVWWIDRPIRRQFKLILVALAEGKEEGKDWRLVTNEAGEPKGIRIMYGASPPSDDPRL